MLVKILLIYSLICIVEAIIFKKMLDEGKIDKLEDECYGTDAWKHRIRSMIPDNGAAIPILFFVFILTTPIILFIMIFGPIKK